MFKTTNNLPFEDAEWFLDNNFRRFRIGTCEGLWRSTSTSYDILAIDNKEQGNGHLTDVFEWFEHSCKRDKKNLIVLEVMNERFKKHLVKKRAFKPYQLNNLIKTKFNI